MFSMISKIFFMLVFVVLIICLVIILPAADNNIKEMEKPTTITLVCFCDGSSSIRELRMNIIT